MTESVCDSWEDLDVDNYVIPEKSKKKPTYSSILAKKNINDDKTKDGDIASIIDKSNDQNALKILQRVSESNLILPIDQQPKIQLEDETRTQFVKGLRILNRPNKKADQIRNENKLNKDDMKKALLKSFEEKQAEYSKARERIFGEKSPDATDLNLESLNQLNINLTNEELCSTTDDSEIPAIEIDFKNLIDQKQAKSLVTVIRQPTVPDNTRGFRPKMIN